MAINLNELEASGKRWEPPSADYPQGKFIDGSGQGKRDGSYCSAKWANDIFGFFGALLHNAGISPNGIVETARNSQFYTALTKIFENMVTKIGVRYDVNQSLSEGEKTIARENIGAAESGTVTSLGTAVENLSGTVTSLDGAKLNSVELENALKELIQEYGGTGPT